MLEKLKQEWPIFILMGFFIWFVVYAALSGRKNRNTDTAAKNSQSPRDKQKKV